MSEREEIMNLIRNEYDPAPSYYKMGDDWDDGAGRIADAILADKLLLLRKHDALMKTLEGIAEFCSGDLTSLGAIARLASIQNEARRMLVPVSTTGEPNG